MGNDGCTGRTLKVFAGCLLLLVGCAACPFVAMKGFDLYASSTAVDVSGACSAEVVEDHFEHNSLTRTFGALEDATGPDGTIDFASADVSRLERDRDTLAAMEVAPCLEGVVAEEVALADAVIEGIGWMQDMDAGGPPSWRVGMTTLQVMMRASRVLAAKHELEEATGAQIK